MPLTIKDIARIAGVSHSTVSRGLNGKPGVSDELRDKIKQIASDLGFEFNANARSLSTAKTGTIGIIYDEENYESTLHIYSMGLLRYMRNSLEREDLDASYTLLSMIKLLKHTRVRRNKMHFNDIEIICKYYYFQIFAVSA